MATQVLEALDAGGDVLLVRGRVDGVDGEVQARGWVSALERHYPSDAYDASGNRREDAKGAPLVQPRAMSAGERLAYCKRLLEEQNAPPPPPAAARPLGIKG